MTDDIMGLGAVDITLERFAYTPWGVFGRFVYGDFRAFTVERPWLNNEARKSCIPEGMYTLHPHESPKFGTTFALEGDTVSVYPGTKARSLVLIHAANTMDDLLGCIALGSTLGTVNDKWAVINSRATVNEFLAKAPRKKLSLKITHFTI